MSISFSGQSLEIPLLMIPGLVLVAESIMAALCEPMRGYRDPYLVDRFRAALGKLTGLVDVSDALPSLSVGTDQARRSMA
jgi:aspartate aminotransferase-like enzyme